MRIPQFTTINKGVHPRALPDDQCPDGSNVIFKDGKVKSRWGYTELGGNLPLDGGILGLTEFTKLRTDESDLIAITDNTTYEYNETSGDWDEFASIYNTGTVGGIGDEVEFEAGDTEYTSICKLSATKIAIAFRDVTDSNKGKCIIANLNGTTPTFGTAVEFEADSTTYISICALSDSKIAIAYNGGTSGECIIATVAGTIPTFGTAVEFEADEARDISICVLSDSKIGITYRNNDDSGKGFCIIATVAGTTPTFGTAVEFNGVSTNYTSVIALSDSKIAVAYRNSGGTNGECIIATVSGTVPTFGTAVEYESGLTAYSSIGMLNDSAIIIAYVDDDDSDKGKCIIATVAGTVPTFGSIVEFEAGATLYTSISVLSSTKIAIAFRDTPDSGKGKCIIATVSGTTPTFGTAVEFEAGATIYISACMIDEYGFAIAYQDDDDSDKGKCIIPRLDHVIGSGATWSTAWPDNVYEIKFGTTAIDGTGTPDTWYTIENFTNTDELVTDGVIDENDFLTLGTDYIIRQSFQSTSDDYFDSCNIIEGLGGGDERQIIMTNGVDPIKLYDGTTMSTLDMTGDGGAAPIETAKYCAYYHGHLMFGWCNDGTNDLPQSVYWSRRGYPTYWDSSLGQGAGYWDLIVNGDRITGMKVLKQRLFVFKEDSIAGCYFTGYTDPAFTFDENLVRTKGCPYGRTIINTGELILYRSRDNICVFDGLQPRDVGDRAIEYIKSIESSTYKDKCFAGHIASEFLYILFIATSATTWTPIALNYKTGSWTIWAFDDEFNTFGVYGTDMVFGDESGNVYFMDLTETDDNGADIDCYLVTKDYPLNEYKQAFMLFETILTTETNTGELQISCSLDFGDSYSTPVVIDQDTADSIYEHVQNWLQRGEQVRFKIENVDGSQFAFESLEIDFKNAGRSVGR